jgi:hypothetical protein
VLPHHPPPAATIQSFKIGQKGKGGSDRAERADGQGKREVGLTPAVAAVGTGVTTALVAKGQEVKGGLEADVTCYINNALAASKGEMIDLRW